MQTNVRLSKSSSSGFLQVTSDVDCLKICASFDPFSSSKSNSVLFNFLRSILRLPQHLLSQMLTQIESFDSEAAGKG